MANDESSRAEELKGLGWSAEDVRRYEELWEYRQRWGAINLEREDRLFLRKAEAALPKRLSGKAAARKSTQDKSYYRWLQLFLDAMVAGPEAELADGEIGAWRMLLEEELRALDYYEPVLGLPDTLKAKTFGPTREAWIQEAAAQGRALAFDFAAVLEQHKAKQTSNWKPLRESAPEDTSYPVLEGAAAEAFRAKVRQAVLELTRSTFPSLAETDKPAPADDWQRG